MKKELKEEPKVEEVVSSIEPLEFEENGKKYRKTYKADGSSDKCEEIK